MKFPSTYKNHTYCSYNDKRQPRKDPSEKFNYHVGNIERRPMSFLEECKNSARLIRESTSLPITVLYSGGFDSEMAMESFRLSGIKIRAAFCRYENDYNKHDLKFAQRYCERYNVPLDIIDLNLFKFWDQEVYDYARLIGCLSPQLNVFPWLMEQLDGCLVGATGDVEFKKCEDGIWRYIIEEGGDTSWNRFVDLKGMDVVPCFPEYTPEQLVANLDLPLMKKFALGQIDSENSTVCVKPEIYRSSFNLESRPKFSGFEVVMERDKVVRNILTEELGDMYNGNIRWTYYKYKEKLNA